MSASDHSGSCSDPMRRVGGRTACTRPAITSWAWSILALSVRSDPRASGPGLIAQDTDATQRSPPQTAERNLRAMAVLHVLGRRLASSKPVAGLIWVRHPATSGQDFPVIHSPRGQAGCHPRRSGKAFESASCAPCAAYYHCTAWSRVGQRHLTTMIRARGRGEESRQVRWGSNEQRGSSARGSPLAANARAREPPQSQRNSQAPHRPVKRSAFRKLRNIAESR
jgi:hypothetical protein